MALIECKDVALAYDGIEVVSELNFSVNEGDYLCVVGENGSGKSSLVKALLGLMRTSRGSIIPGSGLTRSSIGYLPQQTQIQRDFPASVREVVLSGCMNSMGKKPFFTKREREIAERNIELLGIGELAGRCYNELSGGQQQRTLLARALCATSRLLVLDEPVTGLDPVATAELYRLISRLNSEMNLAVIMVSHDIHAAVKDSSHILHLYHKPLFFGPTCEYVKSDIARPFLSREQA